MKTPKNPAEILALWEGGLSRKKRKALLAVLNEDENLRRTLAGELAFEDMFRLASAGLSGEATENAHTSDEVLIPFVQGKLAADEAEEVRTHLRTCRECFVRMARLQRALKEREHAQFAAVPESLAQRGKQLVALPVEDEVVPENFGRRAASGVKTFASDLNQFLAVRMARLKEWWQANPKLIIIPAGAGLAIALLIMLLLPKPVVENFTESRLIILDDGPLGFTAQSEVRRYEGMRVAVSEDGENLIFQWPAIPEAVSYEVLLIAGGKTVKRPLLNGAEGFSFALPKQEVELDVKYTWELRGKLKDGRAFVAKAGFVRRK